jgi:nucleotide-binding universal stress UspA family protein
LESGGVNVSKWKTITVGVDGSRGSRKALTWAAAEAIDHNADLVVLTVWEHRLIPPLGNPSVPQEDLPDEAKVATDDLLNVIKEELGENPPVVVQPRVRSGHAADVLITEAADSDLLVVGTRGHGGFTGLVLGSVSQHVASYARCPVAVVR